MKGISIRQPWPWAILHLPSADRKDVENRTWATKYRGPLVIHAGKQYDHEGHEFIRREMGLMIPKDLPCGGIVGKVEMRDCVTNHTSRWFFGPCGWLFGSPVPLRFYPYPGKLGFMEIPDELVAKLSGYPDNAASLDCITQTP